jgi:hypothetical protein
VPPWCVRELSGRHELSNAALAMRPLAAWSEAERRELLPLTDAGAFRPGHSPPASSN